MKGIYWASIINGSMGEISAAEFGSEWNGDVRGYLENLLDSDAEILEGIPGDIVQDFEGYSPESICTVYTAGEAREIWFAAE